jgi:hypothetical protein
MTPRRLQAYDDTLRKDSIEYKQAQKVHAIEQSPAGKRAIEIEAASLADRLCRERGVFDDIKARTLVHLEAKELAIQQAKVQVDFIADLLEYSSPKGTLPDGDRIGAWLLASKIPEHGTPSAHASSLHVGEVQQLLALKKLSTEGLKPELVE